MFEQFVTDYIKQCIEKGFATPVEICNCAKEEIDTLEEQIKAIEIVRTRQLNLKTIVKRLGGEVKQNTKNKNKISINIDSSVIFNDLNVDIKDICIKICKFVEEKKCVTISDILYYSSIAKIEDNPLIYSAIKWLVGNGYLARDNSTVDRVIIKGDKWEERPR